jgi:hypothetical protein
MSYRTSTLLGLVALFAACTGAPPAVDTATAPPVETPPPPLGDQLPADMLAGADKKYTLVPSPVETQGALASAGIESKLADFIQPRQMQFDDQDIDDVAVRTGVVIADMLLTVKTASNEQLIERLERIKVGMKALNGGDDIGKTIDDLVERVKAGSVSRDELLKELDELSGAIIPELEFNGNNRVVPLIQAGSWLQGANLVAKACDAKGTPGAADGILKQPHVVDYFIEYVKGEGKEKAPAAVTEKLEASLATLKGLAAKPESLTADDIKTVIQVTEDVLALL